MLRSNRSLDWVKLPYNGLVFACCGLFSVGYSAVQNINHLRPLEPLEWHRTIWDFGVVLSLFGWTNLHAKCTWTYLTPRHPVERPFTDMQLFFCLFKSLFSLPLFSLFTYQVFVELLVGFHFYKTLRLVHCSFSEFNQLSFYKSFGTCMRLLLGWPFTNGYYKGDSHTCCYNLNSLQKLLKEVLST